MTKQVRQAITPTHILGSTGTAEGDDLGHATLGVVKGQLGLGTSLTVTSNNGDGTAAAPAYTFVGDTNTGVFRPVANALAMTTNGSERMRIDSSGNVGIGTSSPRAALEVTSAQPEDRVLSLSNSAKQHYVFSGQVVSAGSTITFKIKNHNVNASRIGLFQLSIVMLRNSNTVSQSALAVFHFGIFKRNDNVMSLVNLQGTYLHQLQTSDFTFTNLGSGECTISVNETSGLGAAALSWELEILDPTNQFQLEEVTTP